MALSLPIHRLKRAARDRARAQSIPLHAALDDVAKTQGFASWSLLAARTGQPYSDPQRLHASLMPGDMVLIAARPRQGKTALATTLALAAIAAGKPAHIFSLDDTPATIAHRIADSPEPLNKGADRLVIDCSDAICADYIKARLPAAASGALVVIDYLQVLDQKRTNPPLQDQLESLGRFARERGAIFVFICQIDRSYDPAQSPLPAPQDIRLPNPLDDVRPSPVSP